MAKNIVIQDMPEGTHLTFDMPDWVKLSVAGCIMLFGRLEHKVIEIAWDVKGVVELKTRLKTARNPASGNFDEILSAIECAADQQFDAIRKAFETLADERNLMVHGAWLMANDKPYVVWHKFLEDTNSVMGEFFEKPRFEHFTKKGNALLDTCIKWHEMMTADQTTGK